MTDDITQKLIIKLSELGKLLNEYPEYGISYIDNIITINNSVYFYSYNLHKLFPFTHENAGDQSFIIDLNKRELKRQAVFKSSDNTTASHSSSQLYSFDDKNITTLIDIFNVGKQLIKSKEMNNKTNSLYETLERLIHQSKEGNFLEISQTGKIFTIKNLQWLEIWGINDVLNINSFRGKDQELIIDFWQRTIDIKDIGYATNGEAILLSHSSIPFETCNIDEILKMFEQESKCIASMQNADKELKEQLDAKSKAAKLSAALDYEYSDLLDVDNTFNIGDDEMFDNIPGESLDDYNNEEMLHYHENGITLNVPYDKKLELECTGQIKSKKSFSDKLTDASYRIAATQTTKVVSSAITGLLKSKGTEENQISALNSFLETEYGSALVGLILGSTLSYVPGINNDERVEKLAEELRIGAMATVGNELISEVIKHLVPAVSNILKTLPAATETSLRVEEVLQNEIFDDEEELNTESDEQLELKTVNV